MHKEDHLESFGKSNMWVIKNENVMKLIRDFAKKDGNGCGGNIFQKEGGTQGDEDEWRKMHKGVDNHSQKL